MYSTLGTSSYSADFNDITRGIAGSFSATTGWDFVTGLGTDKGLYNK
jgi:hypothetical protein